MRPVIGIISNFYELNDQYPVYAAGTMNTEAIARVSGCIPLIVPAIPDYASVKDLMAHFDGFVLTGGRPNVHPEEYGHEETEAHGEFDRNRDRLVLPLVRACVEAGQPVMGICRGFQEVNVAMGGTLHPEIRDLEGRDNHRMPPDGTLAEKFELRHDVEVSENGPFHKMFGAQRVLTNTLHGQGICQAGPRVVIDGRADDGTPEAIYIEDAPGFTMSVQWHPEWNTENDPVSKPLFEAFGDAARAFKAGRG